MMRVSEDLMKVTLCVFNVVNVLAAVLFIVAGAVSIHEVGVTNIKQDCLTAAVILIAAGAALFIVTFMGCFGSTHDSFVLLMGFSVGLIIILALEVSAIIIAAMVAADVDETLKTDMENAMGNYNSEKNDREFWDFVQKRHECCGLDGFHDWEASGQTIPETCCHEFAENRPDAEHDSCKAYGSKEIYVYQSGCYQKFRTGVKRVSHFIMYTGIALSGILISGTVLGFILAFKVRYYD